MHCSRWLLAWLPTDSITVYLFFLNCCAANAWQMDWITRRVCFKASSCAVAQFYWTYCCFYMPSWPWTTGRSDHQIWHIFASMDDGLVCDVSAAACAAAAAAATCSARWIPSVRPSINRCCPLGAFAPLLAPTDPQPSPDGVWAPSAGNVLEARRGCAIRT